MIRVISMSAAVLAFFIAAKQDPQGQPAASAWNGEPPCIVVWHMPGYPGKTAELRFGLEIAVWRDDTVLLSSRQDYPGKGMLIGRVDAASLKDALAAIESSGFPELKRDYPAIDAQSVRIELRRASGVTKRAWTECLMPGVGGDLNSDEENRAFVRAWRKTRGAIAGLEIVELRSLEQVIGKAKEFRGYLVDAPVQTSWRP